MKQFAIAAFLVIVGVAPLHAESMEVFPKESRPALAGPAQYFSGTASIDPLFTAKAPARVGAGEVTFSPGARSAWHTHPAGQLLIVTSGTGWVQESDGQKREIKPGDVIWTPPGIKHWHGATATTAMAHIAITETVDGRNVDWLEKVSDDQYRALR